jgi:ubiquinone/menaquinone biosynthesis C-methylase UbiE
VPSPADAEFDRHASTYAEQHEASVALSGEEPEYFAQYKIDDVVRVCALDGLKPARILDFGAGIGNSLGPMQLAFPDARISGIDVSSESLEACRKVAREDTELRCYDGQTIPYDDGTFDLAFAACVFHHIPAEQHVASLREIRRVLGPQGRFVLYEHNPWNTLTVHAVRNCPFDENAVLISAPEMARRLRAAGFGRVERRFRVFFPRILSALRPLEWSLSPVPIGAQYMLVGSR